MRFIHIYALSSSLGPKIDFDMVLLVMASAFIAPRQGQRGYNDAQAR